MNIEKITVRNFKNFGDEVSYNLNNQLTTIIGINGKGKSSLLTALKIAAGAYLLGIPDAPKRHIFEREIKRIDYKNHLSSITPTLVKAEGSIDGKKLKKPWVRQIPEGRTKTTANLEDIGEIKNIAEDKYNAYRNSPASLDNPVIAFFGTARLYGTARHTLGPYIGRELFKLGYYNWSNMQYTTYNYMNWLKAHRFMVADNKESPLLYTAFMDAIKISNPYIMDIGFDGQEIRLKVKMQDSEQESPFLPLSLHSDGVRTHTAMVAELAYRCIMLNAHHDIEVIKKSRGIILIDEIDLHIHPVWQRHILQDLKEAFPKIQFVVTTHSPFIVQSLESNELINLDAIGDVTPSELTLDEISTHVMMVESEFSVQNDEKSQLAKEFLQKLGSNDVKVPELKKDMEKASDPSIRAFMELTKIAKGK